MAACSAPVDGQAFAFEITFAAGSQVPASAQACCVTVLRSHTSSLQAANGVVLAAADETTRQHCMRAIKAASADACSLQGVASAAEVAEWKHFCSYGSAHPSTLQDIASSVALTRDLVDMKSPSASKAVLDALGIAMFGPSCCTFLQFATDIHDVMCLLCFLHSRLLCLQRQD